jgi:fructokinase
MRRVIGIGETILDILFNNNQPVAAVPGGSTFNAMVSLSRLGVPTVFVSEVGDDKVGSLIRCFMEANKMDNKYVEVNPDARSAVSLAFLNDRQDAEYVFYKDHPKAKLDNSFPVITSDDIVLFGSYYALNPVLRPRMVEFLETARDSDAIIYYDVNFRQTHQDEAVRLSTFFIENFEFADIVRGSKEDFHFLYRMDEVDKIYQEKIRYYTPYFIYTAGEKGVELRAGNLSKKYLAHPIQPVSTVGAGDNFNAGILFGLLRSRIRRSDLSDLTARDWDDIIRCGLDFSS